MNQETIFNNIKNLLPILQEFRTKGRATISNDDKLLLKETYQQIIPVQQMDLACSSCILHYLTMLESYMDREYPKYLESTLKMESQVQEVVQKKKGRKKKDPE